MKRLCLLALVFISVGAASAQEQTVTLDELVQSAQQWAQENLDEDALRVLQSGDEKKVKQFLADIEKKFHGEYIVDLAPLKDTAKVVIPVLEQYEETLPYAIWLKSQWDYFEVSDQIRLLIPAPKKAPGKPPQRPPNPAAQAIREIWIKRVADRPWPKNARDYVPVIKPIFAAEGIPQELIWVAEVESGFDPRARSPVGALGMFQLMPATAKRYGLRTWPADQRLKPEPSAGAAAQYLRYLHNHFRDWRLALAAYNAGEGTVDKLLARYKATSYDVIATHLPAETQLYVPRVESTIIRREGVRLDQLEMSVAGANR